MDPAAAGPVEVAHPLSGSGRPTPRSRRTIMGVPRADSSWSSGPPRPVTYFDLQVAADPTARTPRPPALATRHSSKEYPSSRSSSTSAAGPSSTAGRGELPAASSSTSLGVFGPSPGGSPTQSPRQGSSSLFSLQFGSPSRPEDLQARSLEVAGSRTPRSFPGRSFASSQQPQTSSSAGPSAAPSPARGRSSLILTREEEEALEARYDLMSDAELSAVHARWEAQLALTGGSSAASPTTGTGGSVEGADSSTGAPLFPESKVDREHPLRILARAGRKLYKAELDGHRAQVAVAEPAAIIGPPKHDELHTDIQEALATSLTASPLRKDSRDPTLSDAHSFSSFQTFGSPSPSRVADPSLSAAGKPRKKSRGGSFSTLASLNSVASAASASSTPASTLPSASPNRSSARSVKGLQIGPVPGSPGKSKAQPSSSGSWMGMWGWRGPGSKSAASHPPAEGGSARGILPGSGHVLSAPILSPDLATNGLSFFADPSLADASSPWPDPSPEYPPYPTAPHFRALFLSTRLLSSEATSLFNDAVSAGPLVSRLAFELVSSSRERNITVPETRRPAKLFPRALSVRSAASSSVAQALPAEEVGTTTAATMRKQSMGIVEQPLLAASSALSRALNSASKARPASSAGSKTTKQTKYASPALPTPESGGSASRLVGVSLPSDSAPAPSVELESIEPQESRPPTLISDRTGLRRLFSSHRTPSSTKKSKRASRFENGLEPLTDRYGFIYDTRNLTLLREASDAGAPAPAVFAGLPRVAPENADDEEEDDWVENNIVLSPGRSSAAGVRSPVSADMQLSNSSASGVSMTFADSVEGALAQASSTPTAKNSRHRSSTVLSLNPSPARAVAAPQPVHVSADVTAADDDDEVDDGRPSQRQAFGLTGRKTIQLLLNQLSVIHERQQTTQRAAWDAFLRKRQLTRSESSSEGFVGFAAMATSGKTGKDDHREFVKLVRGGIPIVYRSKVWLECSGAHDLMAPGEYAELLEQAEREGIASTTLAEIEKDVVRTLPLNVFFGGDGPGVPKLRRLLTAYAWRNLDLGYCQGLNMLAATLLLTHEREEEAFWVFTCVVERLMPPDYYTPSLLCSRADQRVLQDLVRQELPRLEAHLTELGVEVAAVSFAWFLSLFTDCLPVETLFRLWDVFFVEGFDVFFRAAVAVLKVNEDALMACDSIGTLYESLEACTSRLWSPDQLLAVELELQTRVLHADIMERRSSHVAALVEELAAT